MKLVKLDNKHRLNLKYILLFSLAFCTVISDILLAQGNFSIQVTISSIFIFLIIGLASSNTSLLIITLLNCILIGINGFNILSSIEALEIYYVWFLYKNNKKNIVVEVLIFWILIALPLIFITSDTLNPNISMESVAVILLIFMNRIFNALIGDMLLEYVPFERIIGTNYGFAKIKTLSNLLIYACIASIVVPIMIFVLVTSSSTQKQISIMATGDLKRSCEYVNQKVNTWTNEEKINLKLKNPIQIYNLIDMLKMYASTSDNNVNFYLVDFNDKVITSDNAPDYMKTGLEWLKEGSLTEINSNTYKWTAYRENTFIIKNYSTNDAYLYITAVNDSKIITTVSEQVYKDKFIDRYLDLLKILIPLSLFVGAFVIILKRYILNSISQLINITNGLPEKLKNNETVIFEKTNIFEIDSLTGNFQTMVDNLGKVILDVESTNKKLIKSERQLYNQAHFDSLTGLPNRHYFIKYVSDIMDNFKQNGIYSDKEGIALFFMDLDKFKSVNDNYGHSAGDKLLKEVANRMKNVLKKYQRDYTFIGRLGGDEFVIEFIYSNKDEIIMLANDLIESINRPININDDEFIPGSSIGICLYPEDGEDLESIFIKSDTSMYKAKYSGGNTFLFYSKFD